MNEPAGQALLVCGNVANLYAEPNSSAEVISQSLLGVSVEGGETSGGFQRVRTPDRYAGWIAEDQIVAAWDRSDYLQTGIATLFADVFAAPEPQAELITKLTAGTRVCVAHRPEVDEFVPIVLPDRQIGYVHNVCLNLTHSTAEANPGLFDSHVRRSLDVAELKRQVIRAVGKQAAATAKRFVGTPYLWGGSSAFGLDCSGFVQIAYFLSGVQLLRDASLQYTDRRFERVDEGQAMAESALEAGDLLTFSRREDQRPTHIGLALGDGRFVHAWGGHGVCIHPLDTPQFADIFLGAVRMSADADLTIEAA